MKTFALFVLIFSYSIVSGQIKHKPTRYFSDPIIVDSASTVLIPTRFNTDLLTNSKIAYWNDYYANLVFYNFITDSARKLFSEDKFIRGFVGRFEPHNPYQNPYKDYFSKKWIFLLVKENDFNNTGRVDEKDPAVLYVCDKHGNNLKAVTPADENVVSFEIFDDENVALIKVQKDMDKDKNFEPEDKVFYFIRLNLNDLSLGKKIEINQ